MSEEGYQLAKDMHGGTGTGEMEEGKSLEESEDRKEWEAWKNKGTCFL